LTGAEPRSLVVDTSAAVAVIFEGAGAIELAEHLEKARARLMPAANRVELGIVIEARLWPAGQDFVDLTGHTVLCTGDDLAATDVSVLRPAADTQQEPVRRPE